MDQQLYDKLFQEYVDYVVGVIKQKGIKTAKELKDTDVRVIDAVLADIYKLQAAGKPLEYFTDGRLTYDVWEED